MGVVTNRSWSNGCLPSILDSQKGSENTQQGSQNINRWSHFARARGGGPRQANRCSGRAGQRTQLLPLTVVGCSLLVLWLLGVAYGLRD
eukprot:5887906-Amphidinium_carterae.1